MNLRRATAPLMALIIRSIGVSNSDGNCRSARNAIFGGFEATRSVGTSFADDQ
jgi:hypothetical protein